MQYFESFFIIFRLRAPGHGTTGRISGTVKPLKRRAGADGFHPPDARIPKHASQSAAGPLLRLQHDLRPAKQRRREADPNVACFAGCTHICKQTPAISTMPVVGVVAHVGIIRAFKTEQFGRPVDRTGDLAVTQLYRNPLLIDHLDGQVGRGKIGRASCRDGPKSGSHKTKARGPRRHPPRPATLPEQRECPSG